MGLLSEAAKYRVVSLVGMAKNTGKTTALSALIDEAHGAGLRLGISSTGRDGETKDLVTGTAKPRVFLPEGALATVPAGLYGFCDAGLEIVKATGLHGPLGQILLCRAAEAGYAQIAGPVSTAGQTEICAEMRGLGADMVLIDGAIDRRSVAAPYASDAVILATGAALSGRISEVAAETAHVAEIYGLPELGDLGDEGIAEAIARHSGGKRIACLGAGGDRALDRGLDLRTGLGAGGLIGAEIAKGAGYVYLPGALTGGLLEGIEPGLLKGAAFIVDDPTKIFVERAVWRRLRGRGLKVRVIAGVKIAAITVNPFSPAGFSLDSTELVRAVGAAVGGIPVMDVRRAGA
ncbi:MAG: hypothetical protein LBS32_03915 [Clostridiales Family XIII bacterium]|jgi:hypothetical protein|nr:hypothetical protein [Clostridiales Family XIII bacterium]